MVLKVRKVVYLILILLLVSCADFGRKRLSCEELTLLRAQVGKEFSLESFRLWVHETYRVPLESIWIATTKDGQVHIAHWGDPNRTYYSATLEAMAGQLVVDDITFGGVRGSADGIVACLGEPGLYSASYKFDPPANANALHVRLLFPEQGVLASGAKFFRSRPKQPPPIRGDFPIDFIRFFRPGTAEQILDRLFGGSPALYEQALQEHKPWPGKWEDIVVEIDPNTHW